MKKALLCLIAAILMIAGTVALAESPAIPTVSLDGDCLADYTNWNDKSTYCPATLTFTDGDVTFTKDIEIKPQGTTSLFAPKKNFTVKFAEGVEFDAGWGAQEKYVLKADYIDPTRSCNVVSAKLAAEMNEKYGVLADTPHFGTVGGFPVWVKINGEDAGIFSLTIPKDAWLFSMDTNNPNHLVLGCEGWSSASRMMTAEINYEDGGDWVFEVGEDTAENRAAFERMVRFVCSSTDAEFVANFDQYLDLDACLNYLCFVNIAYANDNVAKNMLMVTYDGQIWYPALYDLDSLWGIGYDGTALAAPQWSTEPLTNGNCLLYRVNTLFGDQVRQRYWELREGILSKEHIMAAFEAYTAQIPQEYYDIDHALWNADGSRIRTLDLMSQLMDAYLPLADANYQAPAETAASADAQGMTDLGPAIHYVWEENGVQYANEDIAALPVSMTLSYTLDGQAISVQDLAGKSGRLEATLRVARQTNANHVYGVTALVHMEEDQVQNIAVSGGTHRIALQEHVCAGSAWLGGDKNIYELQMRMDVTNFDPAKYMVVINPVHFDGGHDNSLDALLATAGELTSIVNEGIILHDLLVELHGYLTNMQFALDETGASVQKLLPSEAETADNDASTIMQTLLADAEAEADAMLTAFGYEVAADITSADRVQLLAGVADDTARTEEEKLQASAQLTLIENYQVVVAELEETKQIAAEINDSLSVVTTNLPEIVSAYTYANDQLYALLYKISMLYQNLSNYYYSYNGGGDFADFDYFDEWYEVIVYSNHDGLILP